MRSARKSTNLTSSSINSVFSDCRTLLEKHHFSEDEIDLYLNRAAGVLDCYRKRFGEDMELGYSVPNASRELS